MLLSFPDQDVKSHIRFNLLPRFVTNCIPIIKMSAAHTKQNISFPIQQAQYNTTNLKLQSHNTHKHPHLLNRSVRQWIFRSQADKTLHMVSAGIEMSRIAVCKEYWLSGNGALAQGLGELVAQPLALL